MDPELLHAIDQSGLQQVQTLEATIQLLGQDKRQVLQVALGVGNVVGSQLSGEPGRSRGHHKPNGEATGQQQASGSGMAIASQQASDTSTHGLPVLQHLAFCAEALNCGLTRATIQPHHRRQPPGAAYIEARGGGGIGTA